MSDKLVPIQLNKDFRRIYRKGKSTVTPVVVMYVCRNWTKNVRVGITASKKVGNAVKRNRSRRVIRAAVQAVYPGFKKGFDYVFVARGKTPYVKSTEVENQLRRALQLPKRKEEKTTDLEKQTKRK